VLGGAIVESASYEAAVIGAGRLAVLGAAWALARRGSLAAE
jgi:hypothetical protein